ncbi:aminoglycoside phosphotransferase (APT) family kinase protein [Nocardioides ginsengisegetis]|uniref:Aminoglycoside phosphotransferase (APT) family kinase protein n=1 Tax=Nocardioides ginsengisegetis TaxID=661491 RepID=A0A7W3IX91_9ACTN|nr:aminoglycoside phosphotransferase (APT) family kinase protein [Nocardioides ginsengisegetis]
MLTAEGLDLTAALAWATTTTGPLADTRELSGGWTSTMLRLVPDQGDPAVLRLMTREPWRTHAEGLTTREHDVQRLLEDAPVRAPRSLALDAAGVTCGHPAHLMTLLPGRVDLDRVDDGSLERLADVLATIHDVPATVDVRTYQSWAWQAKYVVPDWATDPGPWRDAFALLRTGPPAYEPCFIHRDFQLRNVLWSGEEVTGVVDWVETSIGPAWLDVAHCCTNIALGHGSAAADRFAEAYARRAGREPQPYFDVMDVVGFLPPPGREGFVTDAGERLRLEERLVAVLERV